MPWHSHKAHMRITKSAVWVLSTCTTMLPGSSALQKSFSARLQILQQYIIFIYLPNTFNKLLTSIVHNITKVLGEQLGGERKHSLICLVDPNFKILM